MRYRGTARVRDPKPEDLVSVSFTGPAKAVVAMAHALASVAVVTSLRRRVQADATVRVDATCYRPRGGRGGAR